MRLAAAFALASLIALPAAAASKVRKATAAEIAAAQKVIGQALITKSQAFAVKFSNDNGRELLFVDDNNKEKCSYALLAGGKKVYTLSPAAKGMPWTCMGLVAVSFQDVDGDGKDDIIVVADYVANGPQPIGFHTSAVYFNGLSKGFAQNEKVMKALFEKGKGEDNVAFVIKTARAALGKK